jgi:hypothetical protein
MRPVVEQNHICARLAAPHYHRMASMFRNIAGPNEVLAYIIAQALVIGMNITFASKVYLFAFHDARSIMGIIIWGWAAFSNAALFYFFILLRKQIGRPLYFTTTAEIISFVIAAIIHMGITNTIIPPLQRALLPTLGLSGVSIVFLIIGIVVDLAIMVIFFAIRKKMTALPA